MSDYEKIDANILSSIESIRSEHHACTARHLSDVMRVNRNVVRSRLGVLRDEGRVTWTGVAGSLRLVHGAPQSEGAGTTDAGAPVDPELQASSDRRLDAPSPADPQPSSSSPSPAADLDEHPVAAPPAESKARAVSKTPARKKAARKKAAAKKRSA